MIDRAHELPRPVAFVLSGGASLGGVQVGMLRALAEQGISPDLVVGTSVGALNGAVLAETGDVGRGADRLADVWGGLEREDVFPGGLALQSLRLLRHGPLFPNTGLRRLIDGTLTARRFEDLRLPLHVVATELLTGHLRVLDHGDLRLALLASTAIPGLFPAVEIDGVAYHDGGVVADVPLGPALVLGAACLVVLDAGDGCHLDTAPRPVPDGMLLATYTALRQRVLLEAPLLATRVPILYLPRPCARNRSPLDLDSSDALIGPAHTCAAAFLSDAPPPVAGRMVGAPHHHEDAAYQPPVLDIVLTDRWLRSPSPGTGGPSIR